ncbi:MAG: hypothetical protein LUG52_02380 [Clostridia bacterium]|nr:hypothetical protein [Clostridia bacterium]
MGQRGTHPFLWNRGSVTEEFPGFYNACSAGISSVTKRIDSNGYVLSLIEDYSFILQPRTGLTTADVFPPDKHAVERLLERYLTNMRFPFHMIDECMECFENGYIFLEKYCIVK